MDFYGDEITAALVEVEGKNEVYVPLKPICDYLGLTWSGQYERLKRNLVLSEALKGIRVTRIPSGSGKRSAGGSQEAVSLPLKFLPGWLFGINAARIKEELRERVIRYQRECYDILWQAFQGEAEAAATAGSGLFDVEYQPKAPNPELIRIREMGLAIARLAHQQLEIEQETNKAYHRLDQAARVVGQMQKQVSDHTDRLHTIEELIQPAAFVSEAQAADISNAVKMLANHLTKQGAKGSQYQAVFEEIYQRFGASGYKNIRRDQYQAVLDFLDEWHKSAGGEARSRQSARLFRNFAVPTEIFTVRHSPRLFALTNPTFRDQTYCA